MKKDRNSREGKRTNPKQASNPDFTDPKAGSLRVAPPTHTLSRFGHVCVCLRSWVDGRMDGCIWMDGWMDRRMDGWMNGWMDGWMDKWMNGLVLSICRLTRGNSDPVQGAILAKGFLSSPLRHVVTTFILNNTCAACAEVALVVISTVAPAQTRGALAQW